MNNILGYLGVNFSSTHCYTCDKQWEDDQHHCDKCHHVNNVTRDHCCQCHNEWEINKQSHCDNCFGKGFVAYSSDGVNITPIISKYYGGGIVYNLKGEMLYNGDFEDGEYDGNGILYYSDEQIKYKGKLKKGNYNGYGVMFDEKNKSMMTKGLFAKSKMIIDLGKSDCNPEYPEPDFCNLCMDDYNQTELFPICGLDNCVGCCVGCIGKFLEKIKCCKGSRIVMNVLLCPFCRHDISDKVVKIYHPKLNEFIPKIKKLKDNKEIIGICAECGKDEIHVLNVECGEQHNKSKYTCDECSEEKLINSMNLKNCPKCGIKVQKADGCHYIKCKCKAAWCFHCLHMYNAGEIHGWNCKHCGKGT